MRSIAMKFAAIALAALFLLTALGSVAGMIVMGEMDRHNTSADEQWAEEVRDYAWNVAAYRLHNYVYNEISTAPEEALLYASSSNLIPSLRYPLPAYVATDGYTIRDSSGQVLQSDGSMEVSETRSIFRFESTQLSCYHVHLSTEAEKYITDTTEKLGQFTYNSKTYSILYDTEPQYTVEILMARSDRQDIWDLVYFIEDIANFLPWILIGSLLLFALCMVYLCWAAGRQRDAAQVQPGGLNALPLDLYTLAVFFGGLGGLALISMLMNAGVLSVWSILWLAGIIAYTVCLLPVGYIFALAAQIKAGNRFWWRRSVAGMVLKCVLSVLRWLGRGVKRLYRSIRSLLRMIPAAWQWLLVFAGMVLVPVLMMIFASMQYRSSARQFFYFCFQACLVLDVALVVYGGWCFASIVKGAKKMAAGDLDAKIDTQKLYGSFRACADSLNAMSDAALLSAREQLKSERMKAELITNVSHDIKTPLTSIINYVDLLQKPHTEEEGIQYLEVLSRQSDRMKKLIDDLMEMSKATTGNVAVEITDVNAAEAVHQALGEFADKLSAAKLQPVFHQPEKPILMRADGRLTWRVMGNLLNNAVKYAMPGTRLYVDVVQAGGGVQISFKNISAESLNISAEELLERFVRGDASRNTEGSGLGLNIAAGLMQAQGGSMELTVDGDLFKAALFFPCS